MPTWEEVARHLGYASLAEFEAKHGKAAEEKNEQILKDEAQDLPVFAVVDGWTARWSSPLTFEHARTGEVYDLNDFQLVLYKQKGRQKIMQVAVGNTGEMDIGSLHPDLNPGVLTDRYAGMALVFRRRSGDGLRLDTPFGVM